jgi:hypothetical protein
MNHYIRAWKAWDFCVMIFYFIFSPLSRKCLITVATCKCWWWGAGKTFQRLPVASREVIDPRLHFSSTSLDATSDDGAVNRIFPRSAVRNSPKIFISVRSGRLDTRQLLSSWLPTWRGINATYHQQVNDKNSKCDGWWNIEKQTAIIREGPKFYVLSANFRAFRALLPFDFV